MDLVIPCGNNYLSLIAHFHYKICYLGEAIPEKEEGRWSDIGFCESGRRRKALVGMSSLLLTVAIRQRDMSEF